MHYGLPLVARRQAAKAVQPSQAALHHPAGLAQATAMRGMLLRNDRDHAVLPQPALMRP